ncbi:transcriptional regulator [Paenibacillus baekrokdamisoli]|uniref:Transcriptional regulator n=2 Tax=Paenibacillus baekrokdamisoli TaxID=1712516 RepID=A0A3G9IZ24_9BACL|nr:transcriptional regulator [Paenibacillus baekrokdamisoli]
MGLDMKQMVKQDQEVIKQHNKHLVLDVIRKHRPISRAEISKATKMSATSIGRIVNELTSEGLVKETALTSTGVGRKAIKLDIEPGGRYSIGVDIQKKRILLGVMDFSEKIVFTEQVAHTAIEAAPEATIALIAQTVQQCLDARGIPRSKVTGIGVGTPGVIDYARGIVLLSATLGWKNISLAAMLLQATGFRTVIDNDLKVKILGEYLFGSAKGSDKTVLINVGTGIGASLIINGEIFRGGSNSAGELGHTTLDPNGNLCECGKRGCLQTYIEESALLSEARRIKPITDIAQLFEAARAQEMWALEIMHRTSLYIGITINNIVCLYNPDTVIISGDLVENYGEILQLLQEHCKTVIWEPFRESLKVIASELEGQAIVMGAGVLALQLEIQH